MAVAHGTQISPAVRVVTARAVALVLAAVAIWDGMGLAIGGDSVVQTPTWAVLRAFPGPVLMGVLFLTTAGILLFALAQPGELLAWVLAGGMALYAVQAAMFMASWTLGAGIVWTAPSKPVALAVLWLLVLRARPFTDPTAEGLRPGRR